MPEQFIVYISSTLDDLRQEREIAIRTIAEVGMVKTTYRADEKAPVRACLDDVQACHLYVGIVGQRYGWVPASSEEGVDGKSITELEYDACQRPSYASGRRAIPRLMFLKDTKAGIPAQFIDALSHLPTAPKIKAFRERAEREQTVCPFSNEHELRAELRIRLREQADAFHREQSVIRNPVGSNMFEGAKPRKGQLVQVVVGCVPGTDTAQYAAFSASGTALSPFWLSPDDSSYLATLDAGLANGQLCAILLTRASYPRLIQGDGTSMIAAAIDMLRTRTGRAPLICEGVDPSTLPMEWSKASAVHLPDGALSGNDARRCVVELHDRIREIDGRLTQASRFALPYLVLAPTLPEVETMTDESQRAFDGFGATKSVRKSEFDRIAAASRNLHRAWPRDTYAAERHQWKCFSSDSKTAERIVLDSVERINNAAEGSRELRVLRGAQLISRRYTIDEYLEDRWGSRRIIERLRESACLILIDEVALFDRRLRKAADELLSCRRGAVVAISPCDPAHTGIEALLDDISYLKVGNLVSRYKNELDPHCEIAANNINRVERWLSATLPALVASVGEEHSDPELLRRMQHFLAQ